MALTDGAAQRSGSWPAFLPESTARLASSRSLPCTPTRTHPHTRSERCWRIVEQQRAPKERLKPAWNPAFGTPCQLVGFAFARLEHLSLAKSAASQGHSQQPDEAGSWWETCGQVRPLAWEP